MIFAVDRRRLNTGQQSFPACRHRIILAWLEILVVPGVAERERAPLREQWTDWMRVTSSPEAGPPLFRIGRSGFSRWFVATPGATGPRAMERIKASGLRYVVIGKLLSGY